MSVEVELLKGPHKGKRKVVSQGRAKALSSVGYVRVVTADAAAETAPLPTAEAPDAEAEQSKSDVDSAASENDAEKGERPRRQTRARQARKDEPEEGVRISPRTGRPVQTYRTRVVKAEG